MNSLSVAKQQFKEANKCVGLIRLLETPEGILALLLNINTLESTNTDYRVSDIIIDFEAGINAADLTEKQRIVIDGTIAGATQRELAKEMGISQQAVQCHLRVAVGKIVRASEKPPKPEVLTTIPPRHIKFKGVIK
ncbi:helix-turn-helix domain-containing protein [Desulfosporosinus sp. BG]|uniref:helix-turn-helix domain-containing protein n=1 Tax=Desulfosporosinus sp. BG TaxID=1633135 RepID=UPI00083A1CDD|nr:helix-turn-helix domain-containing protein [Desulfosporosinus sp. BG]ODA41243.1 hypothetical protein DSBG_2014 [Desulfosporosinus sp. BG]